MIILFLPLPSMMSLIYGIWDIFYLLQSSIHDFHISSFLCQIFTEVFVTDIKVTIHQGCFSRK